MKWHLRPDWKARLAFAFLFAFNGAIVGMAFGCHGCGHIRPAPPANVACETACTHEATLPCDVTFDLCERLCDRVSINQPLWPGCVSVATTCAEFNACKNVAAADGGAP